MPRGITHFEEVSVKSNNGNRINVGETIMALQATTANNYKVINVRRNDFANCKFDGTDDYANLMAIVNGIANDPDPIELWFPPHNNVLMLSDYIKIERGNIRLNIQCNIQFTKTVNTNLSPMRGIYIIGKSDEPIENVSVIGNKTNWIDGNGHNCTENTVTDTALGLAQSLRIVYAKHVFVADIQLKNGYKDCLGIGTCQHGLISNVECHSSIRDNGFSIGGKITWETVDINDPRTYNDILVDNCRAYNCTDIGFGSIMGLGITFNRCNAYNCGNNFDNNSGGGFSCEVKTGVTSTDTRSTKAKYIDCNAYNCTNYGFYATGTDVEWIRCKVDGVIVGDSEVLLRKGSGWMLENQCTGNLLIKDCTVRNAPAYGVIIHKEQLRTEFPSLKIDGLDIYGECERPILAYNMEITDIKNVNVEKSSNDASISIFAQKRDLDGMLGDILQADNDSNGISDGLSIINVTGTLTDGVQTLTASGTTSTSHYTEIRLHELGVEIPKAGDKLYFCGLFANPSDSRAKIYIFNKKEDGAVESTEAGSTLNNNTWEFMSAELTISSVFDSPSVILRQRIATSTGGLTFIANGESIKFQKLYCINKTKIFGAGNEPTKTEMNAMLEPHLTSGTALPTYPRGRVNLKDITCGEGGGIVIVYGETINIKDIDITHTVASENYKYALEVRNANKVFADDIKVISSTALAQEAICIGEIGGRAVEDAWITNIKTNKILTAALNVTNNHTT